MASIDRYRPPREGYQPPLSPSEAPSPIQISVQATRRAPGSSIASRPFLAHILAPAAVPTRRTLSSTPVADNTSSPREPVAGAMVELPQTTLWVAAVFFHRFYMRCSMAEEKGGIHHYNIAATALFLANKTEENCRKTKDIIYAVVKVAQKNPRLIVDEQSKEYWKWRDSILMHEELMLEMLTFDLMVDNPYQRLYECLTQLDMLHNKRIRDAAWAFCCDSALTVLPLLMNATAIAISAIFFATVSLDEKIEDGRDGDPWWRVLKGDEALTQSAISVVMDFYSENPLRKSDSRYQGSPIFSLENTRRGRELPSQTEAGSSHTGTPMGTDRGTQSPRARYQGRPDREDDTNGNADTRKESGENGDNEPAASQQKGDSDANLKIAANDVDTHVAGRRTNGVSNGVSNGLKSPASKRKTPEIDLDDPDRETKRARLSDEDEGEVPG
ncbi:hypothetical protein INS49_008573 [Diaporthe citri]|uniref:uncharacterized protein n=1 Tax=Diaporthe citri TaxID=83186 RepID=UPI001C80FA64|nr:uncharacterized protein INS49_008573 [Diaporthe citri]KAG6363473.1 hypothetical protein INS49_008573 [Diaporthe citri]